MEDNFMYDLQQQPSSDYMTSLQKRLNKIEVTRRSQQVSRFRATAIGLVAFALIVITNLLIPSVRAGIKATIVNIAGQVFDVTTVHPGLGEQITEVTPEFLPVEEALAKFPVQVKLPTFLPEAFLLDETARIYLGFTGYPDTLEIVYSNNQSDSGYISLRAITENATSATIVGTDSVEEVAISETLTGALVKGGWSENTKQWEDVDSWHLSWLQEGVRYTLSGSDVSTLIKMASSFR